MEVGDSIIVNYPSGSHKGNHPGIIKSIVDQTHVLVKWKQRGYADTIVHVKHIRKLQNDLTLTADERSGWLEWQQDVIEEQGQDIKLLQLQMKELKDFVQEFAKKVNEQQEKILELLNK
tara:strand:+ start:577 stop:933 length:357 start_codon:yes stop_codon:yes gene_type:complete